MKPSKPSRKDVKVRRNRVVGAAAWHGGRWYARRRFGHRAHVRTVVVLLLLAAGLGAVVARRRSGGSEPPSPPPPPTVPVA